MALKKYQASANIYDYQRRTGIIQSAYLNKNGEQITNVAYEISYPIAIKPNTTYTWQFGGVTIHAAPTVCFYDSSDILISGVAHTGGTYFSFDTPSNAVYLKASVYTSSANQAVLHEGSTFIDYVPYGITAVDWFYRRYETATDVVTSLPVTVYGDGETNISLLLKGNTETSGNPSPQNPVTVDGVGEETANLLCMKNGTYTYSAQGITATVTDNNLVTFNGTATAAGGRFTRLSDTFTLQAGTYKYRKYGTSTATPYIQNSTSGTILYSPFTISEPTDVFFGVNVVEGTNYTGTTLQLMLTDSNYDGDYEPFGYKISISSNGTALTPMYLTGQLFKVGDYTDDVNSSGTATYNVAKYEFTGQEAWTWAAGTTFRLTIDGYLRDNSYTIICTHYTGMSAVSSASGVNDNSCAFLVSGSGNNYFYINDTNCSTTDSLKTYLQQQYAAGTPVTVYYVLATATTESVTAPSITTTGGEVSIDVDTTVKPSEIDLTYHGWHTHEPLKRENGQWE